MYLGLAALATKRYMGLADLGTKMYQGDSTKMVVGQLKKPPLRVEEKCEDLEYGTVYLKLFLFWYSFRETILGRADLRLRFSSNETRSTLPGAPPFFTISNSFHFYLN